MALLQRIAHRGRRLDASLLRLSSSAPPPADEAAEPLTDPAAESEAEPSAESGASSRHYRTNPLLPKCAFLFPAKPRVEEKRLHLRSLRRAKLSTVSCLHHQETRKCAWCETPAVGNDAFCPRCQKILPVEQNLNLFRIFDLEPAFDIDVTELEAKYKHLQMQLHPDRFASKGQQEQDLATAQASMLNKAYHKLKQPLNRAKYLLRIKGFQFDKEQTIRDPEFLMEMLEIQERVEEANDREELLDILSETQHRTESLRHSLSRAFANNDLNKASEIVTELSYLDRVLKQTRDKM